MNPQDYKSFTDAWANAHEVMPGGKQLSQGAMQMVIDALKHYPLSHLMAAISKHVQIGKFAPMPKDIIDLLEFRNKRMTADEAWAMMPRDESETVVMTEEMAAAYDVAFDQIIAGDLIAGRMSYKAAYDRLCLEAVIKNKPVVWKVSLGHDKKKIEPALLDAVEAGRLSKEKVKDYLPTPMDGGPIGKLITGKVTEIPKNNEVLRGKWKELGQALKDGQLRLEENEIAAREQKRMEFEQRRADALKAVEEKMQGASLRAGRLA